MLITRTHLKTAAMALFVTAALAGCGDSDDVASTPTTASTPASTPPVTFEQEPAADPSKPASKKDAAWAEKLCTAMVGRVSAIRPPTVAASSPEATLKSLTGFFTSVVEEQGSQLSTLEDIGPPPEAKAKQEWQKTVDELRSVRKDVSGVVDGLEESSATSEAEVTKLIASLQTQLATLGSYRGPIKSLYASKTVGQALLAEPACEKVS